MDPKEILAALEAILNSNEFGDSATYKNLLAYLVKASVQNKIPKEITVAIEVFEKDPDFNSNKDSTVRHHVHTLRKKLDKYYQNEGSTDKIRFIIPKGHYEVKFIRQRPMVGLSLLSAKFMKNPWIYVALLLLVSNIVVLLSKQSPSPDNAGSAHSKDFSFWSDFFSNQYPTAIIIGNDFLLDEFRPDLNRYRQIRDWEINSEADLNKFLLQFPEEKTWQSEINGIPPGMITNLFDLFHVIKNYKTSLSFSMSANTNLETLKNHNLIYIGEFRNLRVLNKILFKLPIRFQYQPDEKLFVLTAKGDTTHTYLRIEAPYQQEDKFNVDYSVLARMPGPADENFLFIAGFGYSGRLERTRMLKNVDTFNKMIVQENLSVQNLPQYFIMVFEVESIERTGFKNSLKYFKAFDKSFFR